eukprot:2350278-Rhodomonas_salina.1
MDPADRNPARARSVPGPRSLREEVRGVWEAAPEPEAQCQWPGPSALAGSRWLGGSCHWRWLLWPGPWPLESCQRATSRGCTRRGGVEAQPETLPVPLAVRGRLPSPTRNLKRGCQYVT